MKYLSAFSGPPNSISSLIMEGVPDRIRGRVWGHILDPAFAEESAIPPSISTMISSVPHQSMTVMEADLRRTYSSFAFFSNQRIGAAVYSILRAYAVMDIELGYAIGMSFIAGMFASYMEPQRALWCFLKLMGGAGREMRLLYTKEFEGWRHLNIVWGRLLTEKFKKVAEHLQSYGIVPEGYTRSWFLTAFLEVEIRPELRLIVFDRFVAFGRRALLSFGLTIVAMCAGEIVKGNQKECLEILQTPKLGEWKSVLVKYDRLFLSEKEYVTLSKRAGLQMFI
jgi:hypothetical protein